MFTLDSLTSLISSYQILAEETEGCSQYMVLWIQPGALFKIVPVEEAGMSWDGSSTTLNCCFWLGLSFYMQKQCGPVGGARLGSKSQKAGLKSHLTHLQAV